MENASGRIAAVSPAASHLAFDVALIGICTFEHSPTPPHRSSTVVPSMSSTNTAGQSSCER